MDRSTKTLLAIHLAVAAAIGCALFQAIRGPGVVLDRPASAPESLAQEPFSLFGRLFPSSYPLAERIRKKGSVTEHLPKGILGHRRSAVPT